MDDPLPDEIDEQRWTEPCRRADAIRDFLRRCPEGSTVPDVTDLADELGLSLASTYRLVKIFREGGTVTSLVDRKRGRRKGHRTLDEARQKIIRTTILRFYLKQTRPPFAKLVREVQTNCIAAGLEPPHLRTIKARLEDVDLQRRAKLRGEAKLVRRQRLRLGSCMRPAHWKLCRSTTHRLMFSLWTKKRVRRLGARG